MLNQKKQGRTISAEGTDVLWKISALLRKQSRFGRGTGKAGINFSVACIVPGGSSRSSEFLVQTLVWIKHRRFSGRCARTSSECCVYILSKFTNPLMVSLGPTITWGLTRAVPVPVPEWDSCLVRVLLMEVGNEVGVQGQKAEEMTGIHAGLTGQRQARLAKGNQSRS